MKRTPPSDVSPDRGSARAADLAEKIHRAHDGAMEALAADVHPYSASAIRAWENELAQAVEELAELAASRG